MADYGLKISKRSYPVTTINKKEQAYNSSNNYIYILKQARNFPATNDIVHGLGFYPMTEVWGKDSSNSWWKAWIGDANSPLQVLFSVNNYELLMAISGVDWANEGYYTMLSSSLSYV